MQITPYPSPETVRELLAEAGLPTEDIDPHLPHFLACGEPHQPTGIVGLELHGREALLRSLVVHPLARGRGCGQTLVEAAESHAEHHGATRLYLLTETAAAFFARQGYTPLSRDRAPASIRNSREFSALCPASAEFMTKSLERTSPTKPTQGGRS